nr:P450 monooxygenase [Saccharopolyspora erythraea]
MVLPMSVGDIDTPSGEFDFAANLLPFDPLDPAFQADPYPFFRLVRETAPALCTQPGMWVVTGFRECSAVLRNPKFGHGDGRLVASQITHDAEGNVVRPFVFMDPPDHTRIRSLVTKAFSARMVERLRPTAERLVGELLAAAMSGPADEPVDLMAELAFALPSNLISELLGMPPQDKPLFEQWSSALGRGLDPDFMLSPEEMQRRDQARTEFDGYFAELARRRRAEPADDLVSALVAVEEDGRNLSMSELVSTCRLLLSAGYLSTAHLIGNGVNALLRHPEQFEWFRAHPDQVAGVVEELLRYDSPVQTAGMRTALQDTEIGDQPVSAGEGAMLLVGAANRDPAAFPDPDRLDVSRKPERNLGFGIGAHFCVGAPLARLTTQVALTALAGLRVELATDDAPRINNLVLRGFAELPVFLRAA